MMLYVNTRGRGKHYAPSFSFPRRVYPLAFHTIAVRIGQPGAEDVTTNNIPVYIAQVLLSVVVVDCIIPFTPSPSPGAHKEAALQ